MEQRGAFPLRLNLTPRCVVWDLDEGEAWLLQRRQTSQDRSFARATPPDVHQRTVLCGARSRIRR
jgi:prophage regulatory protein